MFLLQLACLLVAARIVGRLVRPLGQPQVVAEMITGVLLGPSLLGLIAPRLQAALFPEESFSILYAVSQLGLVLYMFLVGVQLQSELERRLEPLTSVLLLPTVLRLLGAAHAHYADRHRLDVGNGPITPRLFTVMVIMAVITTIAAGPLYELVYRRGRIEREGEVALATRAARD